MRRLFRFTYVFQKRRTWNFRYIGEVEVEVWSLADIRSLMERFYPKVKDVTIQPVSFSERGAEWGKKCPVYGFMGKRRVYFGYCNFYEYDGRDTEADKGEQRDAQACVRMA